MSPVSFSNLQSVPDARTRFVDAGHGQFKAADRGFMGKAIGWLKETFRPGLVKRENVQAYRAAKQAFIDAGGGRKTADFLFDASIASKKTFTPASIRPAMNHLFSPETKAIIEGEIRDQETDTAAGHQMHKVDDATGDGGKVSAQFALDVHRDELSIGGQSVVGSASEDALRSFAGIATSQGFSSKEREDLSKFINQRTLIAVTNQIENPEKTDFRTTSGVQVVPSMNFNKSWAVQRSDDGSVVVRFTGKSELKAVNVVRDEVQDGKTYKSMEAPIDVGPGSKFSVEFSLSFEPSQDGGLALRSLDGLKMKMALFGGDGKRFA